MPEPRSRTPDASELFRALSRLPPRSAQLLGHVVLERRGLPDYARAWGIDEQAAAIHLLRSTRLLALAMRDPASRRVLPEDELRLENLDENVAATDLARALTDDVTVDGSRGGPGRATPAGSGSAPARATSPEVAELTLLLQRMIESSAEIRRIAEQRHRAEQQSPAYRRNEWLRRLALVALVAVALWLYFRTGR